MKKSQQLMVWLLPVILIGGWFYPLIGYLVLGMIIFFSVLSFFKGRYWCRYLCPRGAFLEMALPEVSVKRNPPELFRKQWFRWLVFAVLIGYLISLIIRSGGNPVLIGSAFVMMCIITTLIATILGVVLRPRAWCIICPMGTLQETISKARRK